MFQDLKKKAKAKNKNNEIGKVIPTVLGSTRHSNASRKPLLNADDSRQHYADSPLRQQVVLVRRGMMVHPHVSVSISLLYLP